ncbi:MAG: acyltransferase domain-containing protein [Solirubrobacteraceae bacterium]|nr:acyltransferase domain-containing protein [Solirubrobacteraceae bacterium]
MSDSREAQERELTEWIRTEIAGLLDLQPHEIDPDRPLTELGLSSRDGVGLVGELEDHLDRDLEPTVVFETPTITLLVRKLLWNEDPPKHEQAGAGAPVESISSADDLGEDAIAVVGLGCRLPGGVHGPAQLWDFLLGGGDAIREVPQDRWEQFTPPGAPAAAVVQGLNRFGGYLDSVSGFDADFFGISEREAELMDPQQRMMLEVTWEALEHAGISPASLRGTPTGVFVGMSGNEYSHLTTKRLEKVDPFVSTGSALSIASNRLSYLLDLRGPSMTVDTACSSSLVAIHQAAGSIASGESTTAIVGGVNLVLAPAINFTFDQAGALSPDGHCKSFSADADGIVRAEGCGVVVLKRLADARRDGNHVMAIIRGSSVNQDGRSNGITAPNPLAQKALLQHVYSGSHVDPYTVDYVEAHGTGTPLGDPIEAGALGGAMGGSGRDADQPLLLGSAKSNFGHLEAAAGVVGFIKLVLSLYHDEIPPSLHFSAPNPQIKWDEDHLKVVTEPTPWPRYSGVARAGVSAFGFGGTNAHIVLEESGDRNRRRSGALAGEDDDVTTLMFGAAQEPRVAAAAAALAPWLESSAGKAVALRDIAHTLARTRVPGKFRGSVTARGRTDLVIGLRALAEGLDAPNVVGAEPAMGRGPREKGPVWIFSGFGSTWNGMGRKLLETEPAFADAVAELDPLFEAEVGWTLRSALEEDQDFADMTKAQILNFGMQVALAALWRAHGVEPAAVIGHSMGEISAAVVAGGLSKADGVKVITHRSVLMEKEGQKKLGGMAVLIISPSEWDAEAHRFPGVGIAVYSSPKAVTIAGPKAELQAAAKFWEEQGRQAFVLPVDGASHSPQVDVGLPDFRVLIDGIQPLEPTIPIYSTAYDDPRQQPAFDIDYWCLNVRNPVHFLQAVTASAEDGHRTFVEISAHPVAEITTRQTLKAAGIEDRVVVPTLRRDGDDPVSFYTSLAVMHAWGHVDATDDLVPKGRKVALPFWQHRRYWIDESAAGPLTGLGHPLLGVHIELPEGDRHLWRADLGTAVIPWLREHRVHRAAVAPASVFAELALAAAAATFDAETGPISLTELETAGLLLLDESTEVTTSLTVVDDHRARVDVYTKAEPGTPMVRVATATVRNDDERRGTPLIDRWSEHEGGKPVDLYERSLAVGHQHGPAFSGLLDPRLHADGSATAQVILPPEAVTDRHFRVHPALLDACLQGLLVSNSRLLTDDEVGRPYVVDRIGSLRIPGDPHQGGAMTAKVIGSEDGGPALGNVTLVAGDGTLLLEARDVVLRPVDRSEVPEEVFEVAEDGMGEGRALIESMRTTDPQGARELLARRLLDRVAAVMAKRPDEVDVDAPLTDLGLDSLMAMRAKGTVENDLGIELPTKVLLQGGCLADLEEIIAAELGLQSAGPRRVSLLARKDRFIEPRDASERFIAKAWEEVLGQAPLSATADFDDLGGTPEAADEILEKMRERLGEELTVESVFAHRSIERQADHLRELIEGNGGNPIRVLRAGSADSQPLFLFHPAGGPTSVYQNLVDLLDEGQAVYGFERIDGLRHIEDKAAHYVAMIRDIAPHGPYRLGGWSLGGALGYEVAQQLKAAGEEIDAVVMIDTTIPKSTPGVTEREILRDRFERFFEYMSETYDIPLDLDIDALVELDEDEQVAVMMGVVETAGIDMSPAVLEHQRTSYIDARIAERYLPERYDGKIILYRATDRGLTTAMDPRYARDDDTLGWDALCDDVEVVHVPGTHITLIDQPGVQTMADHLRGVLSRRPAGVNDEGGAL